MDELQLVAASIDNPKQNFSSEGYFPDATPTEVGVSVIEETPGAGSRRQTIKTGHTARTSTMNPNFVLKPSLAREEQLESLMQRRLGNRIRDLRIAVLAGGVVLQGRTSTYHAKQLAQHAAMELTNLPILANDIEVR